MTKKLLVLTGGARPNSVANNLLPIIERLVKNYADVSLDIAKAGELDLPFYDATTPPSAPGYEITNENVKAWSEQVASADAVIWLMPEYNHSITAVQKNAIDWLYQEWRDKPLGMIAYGFYEGKNVLMATDPIVGIIKPDVRAKTGLAISEHIDTEGMPLKEKLVEDRINSVIESLI